MPALSARSILEPKTQESPKTLRPDPKGRVTLGALAQGVSSFLVETDQFGVIHLIPQVEIPVAELWLHRNAEAMASVKRGIAQADAGDLVDLGDFAAFTDEE